MSASNSLCRTRDAKFTLGKEGVADAIAAPFQYGVEYRMRPVSRWPMVPALGLTWAERGANFLYTNVHPRIGLADRWALIPSVGVGSCHESEDIPLGSQLEFRASIELAYRLGSLHRVGVALYPLSNAGLSNVNPGTEAWVLSFRIPLLH